MSFQHEEAMMISSIQGVTTAQNANQPKIPVHLDPIVKLFNIVVGDDLDNLEKKCIKALVASFKTHKLTYITQWNPAHLAKLKDLAHKTIMIHAIKPGYEGLIEYFVKNNVAIHDPDLKGNTPLHYCVRKNVQSIPLFLNYYPFTKLNLAMQSPLHVAIIEGRHEALSAFIEKGCKDLLIAIKEGGGTWTPLALSAKHGYNKCVDLLLNKETLFQEVGNSANLLHVAIQYRHPETVEYLLSSEKVRTCLKEKEILFETFIEKKNSDGQTPLSLAAKIGDVISIQLLFDKGASLETEDFYHNRPIHHAVQERQFEAVKLLTLLGADIKVGNYEGKTPLEIVRNDDTSLGRSIFDFLSSFEKDEFLNGEQKQILMKSGFEAAKSYFERSLFQASTSTSLRAYTRYIDIPAAGLEKSFDGRAKLFMELERFCLPKGWTPKTATTLALLTTPAIDKTEAAVAFAHGHAENFSLIKYINCATKGSILQGYQELANFIHIVWEGETTIQQINREFEQASFGKKPWLLILDDVKSTTIKSIPLPKKGGAIIALSSENQTIWPDEEVVFEIPSLKDPNHVQNQSPLHRAAQSGRMLNAAHLVMHGAKPNAVDTSNRTPLFIATEAGHDDVAIFLLDMGANMTILNNDTKDSVLHVVAMKGNAKLLDYFLKQPASKALINQVDYEGKTPLHKAVFGGNSRHACVDLLCKQGADVLAKTNHGYIALHWACKYGHLESVKILIEKNSPIDLLNVNQDSPFDLAMKEKQYETIHYLLNTKKRLPKTEKRNDQSLGDFYQQQIHLAQSENLIEEQILYLISLIHLYHREKNLNMSSKVLNETMELQKKYLNNPNLEKYLSKLKLQ